jgi:hypothetical protein
MDNEIVIVGETYMMMRPKWFKFFFYEINFMDNVKQFKNSVMEW